MYDRNRQETSIPDPKQFAIFDHDSQVRPDILHTVGDVYGELPDACDIGFLGVNLEVLIRGRAL